MNQLAGKVAIVTGGTTGIGLATAKRFAAEGAYVFVTGRRKSELDAAVEAIGGNVTGVQGDVANLADLDNLFEAVGRHGGGIDVLFANAGGGEFRPLAEVTEEHFDRTFGANVRGTLFTVQKALPLLNDGASIVLTGSTAGSSGTDAFSVYGASKAAIRSFARNWAVELKGQGIRVNVVAPGPIDTPGITGLVADEEQAVELRKALAAPVPLGRMGDPDEVASAVLFLASAQSSFVNGAELFVDGGLEQV